MTPEEQAGSIVEEWLNSPYPAQGKKGTELKQAIAAAIVEAELRGAERILRQINEGIVLRAFEADQDSFKVTVINTRVKDE